jgi:hypothetical protein
MHLSGDSLVVVASDQLSCDLAGEVAILDVKSGMYLGLNTVGARIWQLIQVPTTVDEICKAMVEEYDVAADRCRRDVLALLQELAAKGLVQIRYGTAS